MKKIDETGHLTEEYLEAQLVRQLNTFSSGPWTACHDPHRSSWVKGSEGKMVAYGLSPAHAEFIAESWWDVAMLINEVRALKREINKPTSEELERIKKTREGLDTLGNTLLHRHQRRLKRTDWKKRWLSRG